MMLHDVPRGGFVQNKVIPLNLASIKTKTL